MTDKLSLNFGSKTDAGKVKPFNTDSLLDFPIFGGHVFLVCDGHDGAQGHGALAAKLTAESIKKYFYNKSYKDIQKALTNAITYANYTVFEQANKDTKYEGISSTLAILIYRNRKVYYAYAGDSRIYKFSDGVLQPLTRDHVADITHPKNAEVTIIIGKNKDLKFSVSKNPLVVNAGDQFLVCTDGLTDQLEHHEITAVLADENMASVHKAIQLIAAVNQKEASDNVSVHVVDFDHVADERPKSKVGNFKNILIYSVLALLIVAAGFTIYAKRDQLFTTKQKNIEIVPQNNDKTTIAHKVAASEVKKTTQKIDNVNQKETGKQSKAQIQLANENTENTQAKKDDSKVYYTHHVQYGENLYRLGLRYHVSQQKLIEINHDIAKNLIAGSYLKIPVKSIYKVQPGDSYSVISDKFNVKISLIKKANKIEGNQPLKKGEELVIPWP